MNSALEKLITELRKLPGVGEKTAQRYAVSIIKQGGESQKSFAKTLSTLEEDIKYCQSCFNYSDGEHCEICLNDRRNKKEICIVENVFDILAIERAGIFEGVYHVLHGLLSPLDKIGPKDIRLEELLTRIKAELPDEVIFALSPTLEGEATMTYIKNLLPEELKCTQIARGVPTGASIEYADEITLMRALRDRR